MTSAKVFSRSILQLANSIWRRRSRRPRSVSARVIKFRAKRSCRGIYLLPGRLSVVAVLGIIQRVTLPTDRQFAGSQRYNRGNNKSRTVGSQDFFKRGEIHHEPG